MISERLEKLLNEQIQKEFFSAYFYLSMEAYLKSSNLNGFAHFFRIQTMEERDHALVFLNYLSDVGGRVKLEAIEAPKFEFSSQLEVFEDALKHEQFVTASIYNIVNVAMEEKDHKTIAFLQWFVSEQVEEEANMDNQVKKLKLIGNDGRGILMLDQELATRTYTQAPQLAQGQA